MGNRQVSVPFFSYQYLYKYLCSICNFLYLLVYQVVIRLMFWIATKISIPLHSENRTRPTCNGAARKQSVSTPYKYMTRGKRAQCKYPAWSMAEAARKQMALLNRRNYPKHGYKY